MKKLLALLMALMLVFSLVLVSCDESNDDSANDGKEQEEVLENDEGEDEAEDEKSSKESNDDTKETTNQENDQNNDQNNNQNNNQNDDGNADENKGLATLNGKTPEELYKQMSEELSLATNMTMVADQDIEMIVNYQGQTIPMGTTKQTVTQKFNGNDFSVVAENNMAAGTNCQYVDGIVYNVQITDGTKIKYAATIEQLNELGGVSAEEPKLLNLPESWFKDVTFHAEENGSRYYIELVLDGTAYEVLFSNMTALQGVKEVSDVTHKVYFTAEGKIDSIHSTATVIMESEGMEITANVVSTSTYCDIGTTVVEAPADADSYRLVDISQLG